MAVGVGAQTLQTVPNVPYVIDPARFFAMTSRQVTTPRRPSAPGSGLQVPEQLLPQAGIISKLRIAFKGTLTVATAAVTTSDQWPYNLMKGFLLKANGQNNLWDCDGIDLAALRFARFPSYAERTDVFPGTVGGGDSVAVGTYTLYLTYEIPIAVDDMSLIGSLYAQSGYTNLAVRISQALNTDLFSANPANATITGTFNIEETFFTIPQDEHGQLIIPDLTRLHGFNATEVPINNVGENRMPLIRSAGQLLRLLVSVRGSATNRLSAMPNAASSKALDALRVEYGGNQRPYEWDPASQLLALNNEYYGAPLPYDRLSIDLIKENPTRDVILMQGVTELVVIPRVGSGVTISGGTGRSVQETLF